MEGEETLFSIRQKLAEISQAYILYSFFRRRYRMTEVLTFLAANIVMSDRPSGRSPPVQVRG